MADYNYNPKAGDGLEKVSAEAMGDALDAGRAFRRGFGGPPSGSEFRLLRNVLPALYSNDSEDDLDMGVVVPLNSLGTPLPSTADPSPACRNPALNLTAAPNFDTWHRHSGQVAVTLQPIAAGSAGRVAVAGLVWARLTGSLAFPNSFAAVPLPDGEDGFSGVFEAEPHGFFVVAAESGTGERWALVNLSVVDGFTGCRGATTEELSQGGSCECSIMTLEHGSTEGTDSAKATIIAYDWFLDSEQTLPSGARVRLEWSKQDKRWWITEAACGLPQ